MVNMVWSGMVWYDMGGCGIVWYGMVLVWYAVLNILNFTNVVCLCYKYPPPLFVYLKKYNLNG